MSPEKWNEFCRYLATGPAVFGENHSEPFARDAAMWMINQGRVKKLFIEMAEDRVAGQMPGEVVREHARKVREGEIDPMTPVDQIGLIPTVITSHGNNPTTWRQVVEYAIAFGVDVFYFDKSVDRPTTDGGMVARNAGMAQVFSDNTEGLGIGMLMINGSDHVNGQGESGGLARACNIEDERVYIFSSDQVEAEPNALPADD